MRLASRWTTALLVAASAALAIPAGADDSAPKPDEPKANAPLRRVVHSIEIATHSKEPFGGAVTLKLAGGASGPMLTFYWGGKCKKTRITTARLELLREAMDRRWPVEIPSFPIKYNDRIHMCMRSVRVLRD